MSFEVWSRSDTGEADDDAFGGGDEGRVVLMSSNSRQTGPDPRSIRPVSQLREQFRESGAIVCRSGSDLKLHWHLKGNPRLRRAPAIACRQQQAKRRWWTVRLIGVLDRTPDRIRGLSSPHRPELVHCGPL